MLKKIMLISITCLTILGATTLTPNKDLYSTNENVVIEFKDMQGQNKDWIGIYPAGSSNAWKNVIKWKWTKDKLNGQVNLGKLKTGNYEVRAFYNNSYEVEARKAFQVHKLSDNNPNLGGITPSYNNHSLRIVLSPINYEDDFNSKPQDWVGLYKKGSSNAWKNVIKWAWARNFKHLGEGPDGTKEFTFKNVILESGEYEVRYFLNNTFKTYMSKDFKVTINKSPSIIEFHGSNHSHRERIFMDLTIRGGNPIHHQSSNRDWIGVYPKGSSNSWKNVVSWVWAKDVQYLGRMYVHPKYNYEYVHNFDNIPFTNNKEYELRYFLNNSFVAYKVGTVR